MAVEQVQSVLRRDGYYRVLEEGEERKLVSVTTVLQTLNKPALVTWAARTAAGLVLDDPETFSTADAAAQGIYGVTENASSRGSTIHQIAQSLFEGQEVELIPKHVAGYVDALKAWIKDAAPEVICTERTLVNLEEGYAGTTDLICRIGGAVWNVDFKTGKKIYDEAALQLAAYKGCPAMLEDGVLVPAPEIEQTAVLLLKESGKYQFSWVDAPLDVFLSLKRVWEWTRGN